MEKNGGIFIFISHRNSLIGILSVLEEVTSASYLFELLQVFIQLQVVQDDSNEETEQDLERNKGTRISICVPFNVLRKNDFNVIGTAKRSSTFSKITQSARRSEQNLILMPALF